MGKVFVQLDFYSFEEKVISFGEITINIISPLLLFPSNNKLYFERYFAEYL